MNTLRTFIAIELPAEILRLMKQAQAQLQAAVPPHSVRWVRVEGIHLTLKFLGPVPLSQIDAITATMAAAARGVEPFTLTIGGAGCFPNPKRPRIVWIGIAEPTGRLNSLQRAVESAISPLGYPPEERGFQPHLTLGRAAHEATPDDLKRVGEIVAAANIGTLGQVPVSSLALIKSDLKPTGAEYTPLQRAHLKS
jgi:RNA 2',3'-cyclic 3'-phosphodiesterase